MICVPYLSRTSGLDMCLLCPLPISSTAIPGEAKGSVPFLQRSFTDPADQLPSGYMQAEMSGTHEHIASQLPSRWPVGKTLAGLETGYALPGGPGITQLIVQFHSARRMSSSPDFKWCASAAAKCWF